MMYHFLDLSKTFDTTHHSILLNKLRHFGLDGYNMNLFKSNRKQYTEREIKVLICYLSQLVFHKAISLVPLYIYNIYIYIYIYI